MILLVQCEECGKIINAQEESWWNHGDEEGIKCGECHFEKIPSYQSIQDKLKVLSEVVKEIFK